MTFSLLFLLFTSLFVANFKDSKEIMMTSDSESEYKYSSSNFVPVQAPYVSQCPEGELRCVNGHCITISQLCDKVKSWLKYRFFGYLTDQTKFRFRLPTVLMVPMKQCAHTKRSSSLFYSILLKYSSKLTHHKTKPTSFLRVNFYI